MRSLIFSLLIVSIAAGGTLTSASSHATSSPRSRHLPASEFIHVSCRSTRYPTVCERSLAVYSPSVHHSPRNLAHAALSVSAARSVAASSFVSRLTAGSRAPRSQGGGAIRDCIETLSDSVDRLKQSVKELNRLGRYGTERFNWHLSNVQTWVSAALTDESTCLDSLAQDRKSAHVRAQIREKIVQVAQVTSNALALVNRLQRRN